MKSNEERALLVVMVVLLVVACAGFFGTDTRLRSLLDGAQAQAHRIEFMRRKDMIRDRWMETHQVDLMERIEGRRSAQRKSAREYYQLQTTKKVSAR